MIQEEQEGDQRLLGYNWHAKGEVQGKMAARDLLDNDSRDRNVKKKDLEISTYLGEKKKTKQRKKKIITNTFPAECRLTGHLKTTAYQYARDS